MFGEAFHTSGIPPPKGRLTPLLGNQSGFNVHLHHYHYRQSRDLTLVHPSGRVAKPPSPQQPFKQLSTILIMDLSIPIAATTSRTSNNSARKVIQSPPSLNPTRPKFIFNSLASKNPDEHFVGFGRPSKCLMSTAPPEKQHPFNPKNIS